MIIYIYILLKLRSPRDYWAGINDGQTMDNSWTTHGPLINASSLEFTVSSIGCAYRAELILGR